jgi:hypothetical protein
MMKQKILYLIVYVTSIFSYGYSENAFSKDMWDKLNYRELMDNALPFKLALPAHYVILPFDPQDEEVGLNNGFFCGERSAIKEIWKQNEEDPNSIMNPSTGVFYFRWSYDVFQKDSKTFSVTDQDIRSVLDKEGVKSIKIYNCFWNNFPVISVTGELTVDSHFVFLAWVGLNSGGGEAILIKYISPKNKSSSTEDFAIWNNFIQNSYGLSFITIDEDKMREMVLEIVREKEKFRL